MGIGRTSLTFNYVQRTRGKVINMIKTNMGDSNEEPGQIYFFLSIVSTTIHQWCGYRRMEEKQIYLSHHRQAHPWKSQWRAKGWRNKAIIFWYGTLVRPNVYTYMQGLWNNPPKIGEVNMIELCLIPEITSPQFVHQFMPISLCNTIYKVMSKVIVIMLNNLMNKVVSPFQSGFIPGRRI